MASAFVDPTEDLRVAGPLTPPGAVTAKSERSAAKEAEQAAVRKRRWIAHFERRFILRMETRAEVRRLQAKLSQMAMQKDYWRQRCAENINARHAAEAEVTRLNGVLADSIDGLLVTK
jgi:hypothetical protein